MALLSFASQAFPAWVFAVAILVYCLGGLFLKLIDLRTQKKQHSNGIQVDTEKGAIAATPRIDAEEEFQLEKRAFFNKVCSC